MGKRSFGSFFVSQWTPLGPPLYADLTGKTVVIIGGNTGIGLEAAKHFARMKPTRLILGCRSIQRGQTAVEGTLHLLVPVFAPYSIIVTLYRNCSHHESGGRNPCSGSGRFLVYHLFRRRAERHAYRHSDSKCGSGTWKSREDEGWLGANVSRVQFPAASISLSSCRLQVNHLSTSLAILLLVPNLVRAAREKLTTSRVVITSSGVHMSVPVDELASSSDILKKMSDPEFCTPQNLAARYDETKRELCDHTLRMF